MREPVAYWATMFVAMAVSACSPIVELARIPFVSGRAPLAVDATSVYVGGGGIFAVPISGGAPVLVGFPTQYSAILPHTLAVALDDQFIYATSEYGMFRLPKTGNAPSRQLLGQADLRTIATDGQFVYWSTYDRHNGVVDLIQAIDINGTGPITTLFSVDTAVTPYPGSIAALAVDGNYVIFLQDGVRLARLPKQGGPVEELISTPNQSNVLAAVIGPERVVFATSDVVDPSKTWISTVSRQPPFPLVQLIQTSFAVSSIALSGGRAWWTGFNSAGGGPPEENSSGAIYGCVREVDTTTGGGRTLSEDGARFGSVVVDQRSVYWMEDNKLLTVRR